MLIIDGRFEWQFKQRDELKLNGERQIASKRRVNHAAALPPQRRAPIGHDS
jgi:hypothetical protein